MPEASPLTFVSVVFEAEFPLLMLQARSIARFVPSSMVEEILVIDNSRSGMPEPVRATLLGEYGELASRVRILRPNDIVKMPGAVGWRSQQVLKLYIAQTVKSPHYVVLDSKNHFARPLSDGFFVATDGRARSASYGYETHPLRADLELVLRYLGLDPKPYIRNFTPTVTPFVLDTAIVKALIADVEVKARRPLAEEFLAKGLTEFFLYSGWVIGSGRSLDEVFSFADIASPAVWPRGANPSGLETAFARSSAGESPMFSVHRRALGSLDTESGALLANWWSAAGLFDSPPAGLDFIRRFQESYERDAAAQRRRELPQRLLGAPRAAIRRVRRRFPS